jgi:hypothetical protein
MNGIGHVDVKPDSGIIESQVCIDEQSGARGCGVTAILKKKFKTFNVREWQSFFGRLIELYKLFAFLTDVSILMFGIGF